MLKEGTSSSELYAFTTRQREKRKQGFCNHGSVGVGIVWLCEPCATLTLWLGWTLRYYSTWTLALITQSSKVRHKRGNVFLKAILVFIINWGDVQLKIFVKFIQQNKWWNCNLKQGLYWMWRFARTDLSWLDFHIQIHLGLCKDKDQRTICWQKNCWMSSCFGSVW